MSFIDNYDQFIKELYMVTYDDGKPFNPINVHFILNNSSGNMEPQPISEFERLYKSGMDILYADFYDSELRIGISFSGGMTFYSIIGASYLGKRVSEPVRLAFPWQTR